jgi:RNA 3'-terminal phosphate cyclase (ATP)
VIEIDGSAGEGGGQLLRTALSLSVLTGQAFTMRQIRASRPRPGLRPQHLAAVHAAARISGGVVSGDRIASRQIGFSPGPVRPGDYHFDIGTAGATSLVLQTVLLPLAMAADASRLSISGGTHVPWSPCFHYLDWHWRPLLSRIGIAFDLALVMAGFYPEGNGELQAGIPGGARPRGIELTARGPLRRVRGLSGVANLAMEIGERQRRQALSRLRILGPAVASDVAVESFPARSRGTVLLLLAEFEHSQACFFALGARGKPAERVADEAVEALLAFLQTDGAVDAWLADQLLLPLALAPEPSALRTAEVTLHLLTNATLIGSFLPVRIAVDGPLGESAIVRLESSVSGDSGWASG